MLATALFDRPPFQTLRGPRHRARRRRPEAVEAAAQLPRPRGHVRHARRRRHALVPHVVAGPAGRRPDRPTSKGIDEARAPGPATRSGTPGTSSRCTPTSTAPAAASAAPTPPACSTATSWPRPRQLVDDVTGGHGRLRPLRRLRGHRRASSTRSTTGTSAAAATASGGPGRPSRRSTPTRPTPSTRLATVLEVLCRVAAPLLPLVTEAVYRGLTGGARRQRPPGRLAGRRRRCRPTPTLVAAMDRVREVCSAAHSIRKANGLRARLPARRPHRGRARRRAPRPVRRPDRGRGQRQDGHASTDDEDRYAVPPVLTVVFKVAAPRLGPLTQPTAAAAKRGRLGAARRRPGPGRRQPSSSRASSSCGSTPWTRRASRDAAGRRRSGGPRCRRHRRAEARRPGPGPGPGRPAGRRDGAST